MPFIYAAAPSFWDLMSSKLEELRSTWQSLGLEDPLWAVLSHPDKRGGRWDLAEFLATGERDVQHYHALICRVARPSVPYCHLLDFGCGIGRLVRPWSALARQVTGVDISAAMLERAKSVLADKNNVRLVLNEKSDLACFADGEFDAVFSLVALQHMPWSLASGYIREFARICQPGGIVAFQLPIRAQASQRAALRQKVVDHLPFGLSRVYRRLRHGSSTVFEMHCTPHPVVEETAAKAGLNLVHREPDSSAGSQIESAFYIFRKATG